MKIGKLFLAAIIALGMMACNNEEVPQVVDGAEATVSVKVVPSSNGPTVRTVGGLNGDGLTAKGLATEYAVMKTQVWIFSTGGVLIGYGESTTDEVLNIPALAVTTDIMVVVNGGGLTLNATTPKSTLEGLHVVMPTDIGGKGLLMTGKVTETLVPGQNAIGYTTAEKPSYAKVVPAKVPVLRVNARVALVDVKLQLPAEQVLFNGLSDLQVAMFNVAEKSKIFGAAGSLADNSAFLYGKQWTSTQGSYVGHNDNPDKSVAYLYDGLTAFPVAGANAAYYYVTENDATNQMLLVLRAKPTLNSAPVTNLNPIYTDANGYTYYPIKVNVDGLTPAGDGKVKRNTQYNIYLTIKGLGNPEIDGNEKAWVDVKVEVQDWAQVDQNVTWN